MNILIMLKSKNVKALPYRRFLLSHAQITLIKTLRKLKTTRNRLNNKQPFTYIWMPENRSVTNQAIVIKRQVDSLGILRYLNVDTIHAHTCSRHPIDNNNTSREKK